MANSAKDEEYVPQNFADKIRHNVKKILKKTPKEKSTETGLKTSFTMIKRITMLRKRKGDPQETSSNGNVTTEKQPDAVEANFESSVGLTVTKSSFDLENMSGKENNNDGASSSSLPSAHIPANDQDNAELKQY